MTYGIKALRRLQLGRESTAGVVQTATTVWRGEGVIEDARVVTFPVEDIGIIPATTRAYQPQVLAKLAIVATPATFEQLPHIFEMAIKATTAGSSDSTGSGFVYNYTMPTTAVNTIKTYTIEGGDNNEAEVMEYSFVTDFSLDFKAGEALMVSANVEGRQVALQAFTSSTLAIVPTISEILASKAKLYVDDSTSAIGTTQITNEILSGSIKVKTGLKAIFTADGNLYFSFVKGVRPEMTMDLTFEHSTFAKAEKVLWRAGTARQYRLLFEGPALTSTGTGYAKKSLIIDMAGTYEKFSVLQDEDGDDTITATMRAGYNAAAALYAGFKVVNELSALP